MISTFPVFTDITLDVKDEVIGFTKKFDLYADFSFINLFSWNTDGKAGVAWLNGSLVVKLPDYMHEGHYIYSILGDTGLDDSISDLIRRVQKLSLVPEVVIENMRAPELYAIAEDRDSFDYIYRVERLTMLDGSKLKNKRQKVKKTKEELGDHLSFDNRTVLTRDLKKELLDVYSRWQKQTTQPLEHIKLEEIALKRLFNNFDKFNNLTITTLQVHGKIEGFSINEVIDEINSICHFEKAILEKHDGLYAVLIHEAAKALAGHSEVVNWEQDLGIPGLKHIKKSYAPYKYYRKYLISKGL